MNFFSEYKVLYLAYSMNKPNCMPSHQIGIIIVSTFDTKVTEDLCSGGFFFFRQISTF